MFDLLAMFFQSFRHAYHAIAHPADDPHTRTLQWVTLVGCLGGNIMAVWSVANAIVFDFRDPLWFWLIMGSLVLWLIGGCVGLSIEKQAGSQNGINPDTAE